MCRAAWNIASCTSSVTQAVSCIRFLRPRTRPCRTCSSGNRRWHDRPAHACRRRRGGGAEHTTAGHHLAGRAGHPVSRVPGRAGETLIPQQEVLGNDESDQEGAATTQPAPDATPVGAASTGRRRPGPASGRMVRPRAARTRKIGKPWMVRRVLPSGSSGDHFPAVVWKRTFTAISARNRS